MHLSSESLLIILLVGLLAGWLAGQIVQGTGFGIIGDIVIGILGAFIGSWLLPQFGVHLGVAFLRLDAPEQHQDDNDDQNRADQTNAPMTVTVSVAAEAPAESAEQEDDKDNYKNKSQRHGFISICPT